MGSEEIEKIQRQISTLTDLLRQKDKQIRLIEASKFWKIRYVYLKFKWMFFHPLAIPQYYLS